MENNQVEIFFVFPYSYMQLNAILIPAENLFNSPINIKHSQLHYAVDRLLSRRIRKISLAT